MSAGDKQTWSSTECGFSTGVRLVRALKYHSFTHSRYTQPKTSAPPGCRAGQRKKRDSEEFDRKKSVEDFCQLGCYKKGFSFLFEQCFGLYQTYTFLPVSIELRKQCLGTGGLHLKIIFLTKLNWLSTI